LLFKDAIELYLRSPQVIAIATIGFGLLLWWADVMGKRQRDEYSLRISDILYIGLAQAVALIPGTSRSGITITAGLMLGLSRQAAARFSFLLSIPVITLAGLLAVKDLFEQDSLIDGGALLTGALISGITAYACIHAFLKLLERIGMMPFVVYRLVLGIVLLLLM
jgi:undecaprenyl-diphosphatase